EIPLRACGGGGRGSARPGAPTSHHRFTQRSAPHPTLREAPNRAVITKEIPVPTKGKQTKARAGRTTSGRRELITPNGDARYVRRGAGGRFSESDDVGRSLAADRRKKAKTRVKSGYGDRGDRPAKKRSRS